MRNDSRERPRINSYDSGYEHSLEHWLETHRLVADDSEATQPAAQSTPDQEVKLAKQHLRFANRSPTQRHAER
jgi:hypothetical protein